MDNRINRNLMIEITSDIHTSDGEHESIVLTTEAEYQVKDGKGYLRYKESEISGMDGSRVMLKYEEGVIQLRRYGTVNSLFIVEPGKPNETKYRTPYGEFDMLIIGQEVKWLDEAALEILIRYTLMMEGNDVKSEMTIAIKEIG